MSCCSNVAKSNTAKNITAKIVDPMRKTFRTILLVNIISVS
jgi:hypothetical protein